MPFSCFTNLIGQLPAFAFIDILHLAERIAHPFSDDDVGIYSDKMLKSLLSACDRQQIQSSFESDGVQAIPSSRSCPGSDTHGERTDFYDLPAIALALRHWRRIAYRRGHWKMLCGGGDGASGSIGGATVLNCGTSSG